MMADWKDGELRASQCHYCANRGADGLSCKAFATIPDAMFLNEFDHRKPYAGDNGVQFVSRMGPTKDRWFLPVMQKPMKV